MASTNSPNSYKDLVRKTSQCVAKTKGAEGELDALLSSYLQRKDHLARERQLAEERANQPDPIDKLRAQIPEELVPEFERIAKKYEVNGIKMSFDPADLLNGGREIKISISLDDCRTELRGIVTRETIAFQEERYSKTFRGELAGGPSLRLRHLTCESFREFICERLMFVIRMAIRSRAR